MHIKNQKKSSPENWGNAIDPQIHQEKGGEIYNRDPETLPILPSFSPPILNPCKTHSPETPPQNWVPSDSQEKKENYSKN